MTTWQPVARRGDVAPGKVAVFTVGGRDVALCNVGGELFAVDDVCTHDGGALDQGELDGDEIECPRHGARFDVRTGRATQLPAFAPVDTHAVRVVGDTVEIGVEPE